MLIEATASDADVKTKSRWTRCLRFAGRRSVPPKTVLWFIQHRGGIAGCAEMFASRKIRVPKDCVGFSTPGYPVVPIFIHKELWKPTTPKKKEDDDWD
jgi:hypothetical protein